MTFLVKNKYYNILLFHKGKKCKSSLEILKCGKTGLSSHDLYFSQPVSLQFSFSPDLPRERSALPSVLRLQSSNPISPSCSGCLISWIVYGCPSDSPLIGHPSISMWPFFLSV